ncbi:hypothetical protein V8D89_009379 [Ganoderma adspersum]
MLHRLSTLLVRYSAWSGLIFLLWSVYEFVDSELDHLKKLGKEIPPFPLPHMRFVHAGFAVTQGPSPISYIVEEHIDADKHGPWHKYINNDSPQPPHFLVFMQHAQYLLIDGLAFVADYQGGGSLLSDAQIVTNLDLGDIFALGNISAGYNALVELHECNQICKYFQLAPLELPSAQCTKSMDISTSQVVWF